MKCSVIKLRDVVVDKHVMCCGSPLPPVNLSSLKCAINPSEEDSDAILPTLPVTDSNISTSHPAVNPHLPMPSVAPMPPVAPVPVVPLPPPVVPQCHMNEVKRLYDFFKHHPLHNNGGGAMAAQIKGGLADDGMEQGCECCWQCLCKSLEKWMGSWMT